MDSSDLRSLANCQEMRSHCSTESVKTAKSDDIKSTVSRKLQKSCRRETSNFDTHSAMSHKASEYEIRRNKYEGLTNSSTRLIRLTGSGDLFAIPHRKAKTGYKSPNSYAFRPVFQDETTNSYFQKAIRKIGEESTVRNKKPVPYYPNAPRNRNPETLRSHVGTRYSDCRNASYIRLVDGNPKHLMTPKTTNQLYMRYNYDTVGIGNQAIFAGRAKRMHRLQVKGY